MALDRCLFRKRAQCAMPLCGAGWRIEGEQTGRLARREAGKAEPPGLWVIGGYINFEI